MRTAIYIEDGVVQLVLTPENDFERSTLRGFAANPLQCAVREGTFYECRGGFYRHSSSNQSLILVNSLKPIQES